MRLVLRPNTFARPVVANHNKWHSKTNLASRWTQAQEDHWMQQLLFIECVCVVCVFVETQLKQIGRISCVSADSRIFNNLRKKHDNLLAKHCMSHIVQARCNEVLSTSRDWGLDSWGRRLTKLLSMRKNPSSGWEHGWFDFELRSGKCLLGN